MRVRVCPRACAVGVVSSADRFSNTRGHAAADGRARRGEASLRVIVLFALLPLGCVGAVSALGSASAERLLAGSTQSRVTQCCLALDALLAGTLDAWLETDTLNIKGLTTKDLPMCSIFLDIMRPADLPAQRRGIAAEARGRSGVDTAMAGVGATVDPADSGRTVGRLATR